MYTKGIRTANLKDTAALPKRNLETDECSNVCVHRRAAFTIQNCCQPTHNQRFCERNVLFVASTKAAILLLAGPPATILWNFAAHHKLLPENQALGIALPALLDQIWLASFYFRPSIKQILTPAQFPTQAIVSNWGEPGPIVFYAAILAITYLLTMYAELSGDSWARQYLVVSFALLCPITGTIMGMGCEASAVVLLPLHIASALVTCDICAWLPVCR